MLQQWLKLHRWYKEKYNESWFYVYDYNPANKTWGVLSVWFDILSLDRWDKDGFFKKNEYYNQEMKPPKLKMHIAIKNIFSLKEV
jgi:hypothetical protein